MTATPQRAFRCDDKTWQAAGARAKREHRSLSQILQTALRQYAEGAYDAVEVRRLE